MQCAELRESILDLVTGEPVQAEFHDHLRRCQSCAAEVRSLQSTMSLLDEWKAPEDTSPYFMTRLKARVRDEVQREPAHGWMTWFRRPALAASFVVLLVAGASLFTTIRMSNIPDSHISQQRISAVNDLQSLDKDGDMLANFELLDDQHQDDSNP